MNHHLETIKKCIEQLKRTDSSTLAEVIDNHLAAAIAESTEPYKKAAEALTNGLAAIEELFTAEPAMLIRPANSRHRITNGDQDRIDLAFEQSKRAVHDYRTLVAPEPVLHQLEAERDRSLPIANERDEPLSQSERRW